jgi:pimeloyl-ACP methyl ester carboxylesterase
MKNIRGLLLPTLLLLCSCNAPQGTPAIDRLRPCRAGEGPADSWCGTLNVRENREARSGRQIPLRIVVLPALKQQHAPDPLFILAGGPGQGAGELAGDLQDEFRPIQLARDIVLVDQRGTGKSNALDCKGFDSGEPAVLEEHLRQCLDSLESHADVTKYTTEIAMDDLDDVRQFLGYPRIDVYGVSYGTRAAMEYVRRHRNRTRAVILDSVAPIGMRVPLYAARDGERALDLLLRDCEKDAACNQRFPNLKPRLDALMARLDAHPEHTRYLDPRTGLEKESDVKRLTVASLLTTSLYTPATASLVPLLIDQAEKGNFSGLFALKTAFEPAAGTIAQGMYLSVMCSEDAPRIEPGAVQREAAGTILGAEAAELKLKPCGFWPRGIVSPGYYADTPSDVPALILSGELDPVTPPSWGADVASRWKNSRHIIVPATGHGASSAGCVMKLMRQFLDEGDVSKLDPACLQNLKRPPFVLGPSGPEVGK